MAEKPTSSQGKLDLDGLDGIVVAALFTMTVFVNVSWNLKNFRQAIEQTVTREEETKKKEGKNPQAATPIKWEKR